MMGKFLQSCIHAFSSLLTSLKEKKFAAGMAIGMLTFVYIRRSNFGNLMLCLDV